MSKWISRILWIVMFILVVLQVIFAAFYTKPSMFCMIGIKDAAIVYENGGFVLNSPLMSLLGLLGRAFDIPPVKIAFNILPFINIPLCYLAYIILAKSLEGGAVKTPAILIFTELLNIYGFQSEALSPYTLLLGWYRGEALIIHLVLPLLLAFIISWQKKRPSVTATIQEDEDEMKNKFLNVRNLSIAFGVFIVAFVGVAFILNQKINNLHNATLSLQDIIESKGEFTEFKGALGDSFCGYIVVDADKNVTVIFGGKYTDGEALFEQLSKYDKKVTSWYLEKDGEQGAFEYCRENGISVEHIYSIGGIEEIK